MTTSDDSSLQGKVKNATILSMTALSPQPYKGTRDYYPADKRVQNYIFQTWKHVAEQYGYEEYGTPLLEPLEVYAAKSGQEIVNEQTYAFTDRGDRQVAIRPEMTPSVSRLVAQRRQELAYPARLYSIANFMRYERPQRGREREFWQLNVDIFGVDEVVADAEIISLGSDILKAFGAKDEMYSIRLNNRKVIQQMMSGYLGLDTVQSEMMMKLFDRKNKITPEEFRDQALGIFGEVAAQDGLAKIAALVSAKTINELPAEVASSDAMSEVRTLFEILTKNGVKNAIFDITLMRGLDYYTGTVFEFFDTDPENNRSLFGGGRYDGLVGLFGAEPISAVGFAPGLTTTELFLASHKLLPVFHSTTEVYVVVLEGGEEAASGLAKELRGEGVKTELDITGRKTDKQIKTALKKDIPFIIFVGAEEAEHRLYPFKVTASTEEKTLSFERIVSTVKDKRLRRESETDDLFV
jgi:histidyl-tRNA synthetase